jgi:hypothetical protein
MDDVQIGDYTCSVPTVVEAPVVHVCEFGTRFELSARNTRIHRNRGMSPKCDRCRYGAKPPKVTEAMRRYWLDCFTLDEIRQMAGAIRG